MSTHKFTQRAVASPDAWQKPLVRKRARSGGATSVRVTRQKTTSTAQKPRAGGSQQPACAHKEHQILSTTEAASFAAQFWDKKTYPSKASQYEFLATCIDVDLGKNVKHAGRQKYTRKRGHQTRYFVPYRGSRREICKTSSCTTSEFHSSVLKIVTTYPPPPTYTFLKRPFAQISKSIHIPPPPPPEVTTFWCIRPKVENTLPKCEFAPCWHLLDVPERNVQT